MFHEKPEHPATRTARQGGDQGEHPVEVTSAEATAKLGGADAGGAVHGRNPSSSVLGRGAGDLFQAQAPSSKQGGIRGM
jgi:hypothetical protein